MTRFVVQERGRNASGHSCPRCQRVMVGNGRRSNGSRAEGVSRQQPEDEETNERKMKHVIDAQWVSTSTRERLAAARKRTLHSIPARDA